MLSWRGIDEYPDVTKSVPGRNCPMSFAVLRIAEWLEIASFPEATSRSSQAASTFSARISRVPPGTLSARATHEIDPFCTPCEPAARIVARHRASRYSIDLPSAWPISASEPPPEVNRTLTPREAYADASSAFDQGVKVRYTSGGGSEALM